jgi:hypothetical protein
MTQFYSITFSASEVTTLYWAVKPDCRCRITQKKKEKFLHVWFTRLLETAQTQLHTSHRNITTTGYCDLCPAVRRIRNRTQWFVCYVSIFQNGSTNITWHFWNWLYSILQVFSALALITPWRLTLLEELAVEPLLYTSPKFYGNLKFITVFKSLPLVPAQNPMNPVYTLTFYLRFILTPPHLLVGHPCGLFLSGFSSQNVVCNSLLSRPCYTPWSSHHMAYYFIIKKVPSSILALVIIIIKIKK